MNKENQKWIVLLSVAVVVIVVLAFLLSGFDLSGFEIHSGVKIG